MSNKKQKIIFEVSLGDDKIPERIDWIQNSNSQEAKAILVSIFERNSRETLRMDLWTKDMQMQEMDRLMFYTLRSLADSYHKATNNSELAEDLRNFSTYFGEKTEILKKPPSN